MIESMLQRIRQLDASQLEPILMAALDRKRELFPQWDILYITMPKDDPIQRSLIAECVIRSVNDCIRPE